MPVQGPQAPPRGAATPPTGPGPRGPVPPVGGVAAVGGVASVGGAAAPPPGGKVPPPMGAAPPPVSGKASPPVGSVPPPPGSVPPPVGSVPPQAGGPVPPPVGAVPPPVGAAAPPPVTGSARAAARRPGTGEQAWVGSGTGEQAGRGSGEQPALRMGSGERPRSGHSGEAGGSRVHQPARPVHILALAAVTVLLLGALPLVLFLRSTGNDPVVKNLNSLSLPAWADVRHQDDASGSRWCVQDCRLTERTWRSSKAAADTDRAFQAALSGAGWVRWQTPGCPKLRTGTYTCWQRDQYVLDLWTRNAVCGLSGVAPSPGAPPPSTSPSPLSPLDPAPTASGPPPTCAGSLVTAKVGERIDPNWHS